MSQAQYELLSMSKVHSGNTPLAFSSRIDNGVRMCIPYENSPDKWAVCSECNGVSFNLLVLIYEGYIIEVRVVNQVMMGAANSLPKFIPLLQKLLRKVLHHCHGDVKILSELWMRLGTSFHRLSQMVWLGLAFTVVWLGLDLIGFRN